MREILVTRRVSGRWPQNAGVSREMRETWQVCRRTCVNNFPRVAMPNRPTAPTSRVGGVQLGLVGDSLDESEQICRRNSTQRLYIYIVANSQLYSVSQKIPPRTCGNFSQTVGNFSTKLYMPITRSYLRQTTNFYSITCNFDEVMPY